MKKLRHKFVLTVFTLSFFLLSSERIEALEVIRPEIKKQKIILKIIRAEYDTFDTYLLTNHNSRVMELTCSNNIVFDNNPKPLIKYMNFYNAGEVYFVLESEEVCKEMVKVIDFAHYAINENNPFLITLNKKTMKVEKIVFPNIDPLTDEGDINDLFPKSRVLLGTNTGEDNKDNKIKFY